MVDSARAQTGSSRTPSSAMWLPAVERAQTASGRGGCADDAGTALETARPTSSSARLVRALMVETLLGMRKQRVGTGLGSGPGRTRSGAETASSHQWKRLHTCYMA